MGPFVTSVNHAEDGDNSGGVFTFSPLPPLRPRIPSEPWGGRTIESGYNSGKMEIVIIKYYGRVVLDK